jgi:hypothetical protein
MTRADKAVVLLLRILGVGCLFALMPVFMPFSWMAATYRWLGLGGIPTAGHVRTPSGTGPPRPQPGQPRHAPPVTGPLQGLVGPPLPQVPDRDHPAPAGRRLAGKLAYPHYVLGVVLGGGRVFYAPDPADHGLLLKLFGYHMGGHYVDVLLGYFREPPVVPESLDGLDEAALRRLLGKLRTRLLLLAVTTPAEALPPEEWLRLQGAMAPTPEPAAGTDPRASALAALRAALEAAATLSEAAARGGPRAA